MAQVYLLSVLYLFISAGLLLTDKYGNILLMLINLKNFYVQHRWFRRGFLIAGCVLALGMSFFPMDPGPAILGDMIPSVNMIILVIYFLSRFGSVSNEVNYGDNKKIMLGFITLVIAALHFLFPGIVLI